MANNMANARPGTDGSRQANGIFISYRRGDSDGQAHALRARLTKEYGRRSVFMDVDSIVPGTDFARTIEDELAKAGVMLVLIGPNWRVARTGEDRLSGPNDFVRAEVSAALRRGIPVIPVLIGDASRPDRDELPEVLRPLVRIQAVTLRSSSWDYDISRVARAVSAHIRQGRRSRLVRRPRPVRRGILAGAGGVALVIAGTAAWVLRPTTPHPPVAAGTAVAAVQPDRLIRGLLNTPFATTDVPGGISAGEPTLSDALTSLTDAAASTSSLAPGLMATITEPFPGNGSSPSASSAFGPFGRRQLLHLRQ